MFLLRWAYVSVVIIKKIIYQANFVVIVFLFLNNCTWSSKRMKTIINENPKWSDDDELNNNLQIFSLQFVYSLFSAKAAYHFRIPFLKLINEWKEKKNIQTKLYELVKQKFWAIICAIFASKKLQRGNHSLSSWHLYQIFLKENCLHSLELSKCNNNTAVP